MMPPCADRPSSTTSSTAPALQHPRGRGRPPTKKRMLEQTAAARRAQEVRRTGDCAVCLKELSDVHNTDDGVARFMHSAHGPPWEWACRHIFCWPCIERLCQRDMRCPICSVRRDGDETSRADVVEDPSACECSKLALERIPKGLGSRENRASMVVCIRVAISRERTIY